MTQNAKRSEEAHMLGELILTQNPYGTAEHIGGKPRASQAPIPLLSGRDAREIGEFKALAPTAAATVSGLDQIEFDGEAKGHFNRDGNRLTYTDIQRLKAIPQKGVWWYVNGEPRYVAKVMRIPYTYTYLDDDGNQAVRTDFLLIGYEGAGW